MFAKKGDKIRYMDRGGYDYEPEYARKAGLEKGKLYVVTFVEIGNSKSYYSLEGIEGTFNTVMFEPFKLKGEKKIIFHIKDNDLDSFVTDVYGPNCRFEFVPVEEVSNDTSKEYNGINGSPLNDSEKETIQHWINGKFVNFSTRVILKDLCNKGLIESGDYVIKASW